MRWWLPLPVLVVAAGLAAWVAFGRSDDDPHLQEDEIAGREDPGAKVGDPPVEEPVEEVVADRDDGGPAYAWGALFFDQAARWVEGDGPSVDRLETFRCSLAAKIELDTSRREGRIRCWYRAPDAFRQEVETHGGTTTHILRGRRGWSVDPEGRVEDLTRMPDGVQRLGQLHQGRSRVVDWFEFLTLRPLQGPEARFRFDGYKRGSGTYAGKWIKITRVHPGQRKIVFWLAYERVSGGDDVRATWPGIVRIEGAGEGEHGTYTEDWILEEWDAPSSETWMGRRFPRRIEAYAIEKDAADRTVPRRFLFALVEDLQVNEPVEDRLFEPPDEDD